MITKSTKIILVVPSLNAGSQLNDFINALSKQTLKPAKYLLIDSGSTDSTVQFAIRGGFSVQIIPRGHFNHGATRQLALNLYPDFEIIVYMTQDSILASPESIKNILMPFEDEMVGAVCGRQLPHINASPIATHARLFNYSDESSVKSLKDVSRLGVKAAFISNSFAAYRRSALMSVGGFPSKVIFGEDTYVAAKMLRAGWKLAYAANALCYHSHNYGVLEEFRRYFDIGVFHSREKWFIETLGKPEGEGKRFVFSEVCFILKRAPWLIPTSIVRTGAKFFGYKLGQKEQSIPIWVKRKLSMNNGYWKC